MTNNAAGVQQPESFEFSSENLEWAKQQLKKYPEGREASCTIPFLWRVQEQHDGWLPEAAIRYVGDMLDVPYIRVMEVATFYTMFALKPVGKYFVQLCGTTPCMLRGSEELKKVCADVIGVQNTVTSDGVFSWLEVECLGACCNAPMVQVNQDYYEDLTPDNFRQLLADLKAGKEVKVGSQTGREGSCPAGGVTSLTDKGLYDGKGGQG